MNHAGLEHLEQMDPTLFALTLEWVSSHLYLIQRILHQANVDQFAGLMYPPALSGMLPIAPMAPVLPDPQPDQACWGGAAVQEAAGFPSLPWDDD
jgi:hypothetical protein